MDVLKEFKGRKKTLTWMIGSGTYENSIEHKIKH